MREYGQIQCGLWQSDALEGTTDLGKLLAAYLLTGPHSNGIGCYRLPDGYVREDLKWDDEKVSKGFVELFRNGFANRLGGVVYIPNFLRWNRVSNGNVATARMAEFRSLPKGHCKAFVAQEILKHCGHLTDKQKDELERVAGTVTQTVPPTVCQTGSYPILSDPILPESDPAAREVPRGPNRVTNPTDAYASLMDDWRRDVPECNPAAFQKWIVHVESQGKPLGSQQRLLQARRLAGNGDFPAQAEVVDYCIEQSWKTLVPLRDVRKRTQGMSRPDKPGDKPKEQRDAEDAKRMRELMDSRASRGIPKFRDPYAVESPSAYETALKLEITHGPRDMSAVQLLAAAKRVNA